MNSILVIDNYDSFTYNLVQYIRELAGSDVDVFRNDQIDIRDIEPYKVLFLSPGPGLPEDAGILKEIIKVYGPSKKMLGVCLGHQAIAEVYGAGLINLTRVFHGVATEIVTEDRHSVLFKGMPHPFMAGRYHSWIIDNSSMPEDLEVLARDGEGQIMALQHRKYSLFGVQFHPESVLTPEGKMLIRNFLDYCNL